MQKRMLTEFAYIVPVQQASPHQEFKSLNIGVRWCILTGSLKTPQRPCDEVAFVLIGVIPYCFNGIAIERRRRKDAQRAEAALHVGVEAFVTHGEAHFDALLARLATLEHIKRGLSVEFFREDGQIRRQV